MPAAAAPATTMPRPAGAGIEESGDALTCALENDDPLGDIGGGSNRVNNFFDNTFSH